MSSFQIQTNMEISDLAAQVFSQPAGSLGIIRLISTETDNEYIFQTLLTLIADGLSLENKNFSDLMDQSYLEQLNEKLAFIGYKITLEAIPYSQGKTIIHYCSINSDNNFSTNSFHPYQLMQGMSTLPKSYSDYFTKRDFLHQVIAVCRIDECILLFRFYPVNLIVS